MVSRASVGAIVLPGVVGQGWDVVETYRSGQKGYERTDTVPVVVWLKKKGKMHKTWYNTLYTTLLEDRIKNRKKRKT
ncbi:hypothetical protein C5S39_14940 [Candidatus Methanophagaceae archaeon]|nr:hypothetical protein C5S39_14940 [Methanophagales archaeon]